MNECIHIILDVIIKLKDIYNNFKNIINYIYLLKNSVLFL